MASGTAKTRQQARSTQLIPLQLAFGLIVGDVKGLAGGVQGVIPPAKKVRVLLGQLAAVKV